ncbi:hypothetical protein [Massilia sp. erpn]|uniref:hypothetical protein n=1 Tax=Massilia sp. erpn TaxID=2738142 RepID=UPI002105597E|nr:hypothetical protein [Massilia sp. erpn]UTY56066.1 hypothetical protein HPQ68_01995 [Massilia sp. erpn]
MKTLLALAAVVALSGCAAPGPRYYSSAPVNPYEWHTVSVENVGAGRSGPNVVYTTEAAPVYRTVIEQPVVTYVEAPVYRPVYAPVYAPAPAYYYPPVSIGLDFVFSSHRHRHYRHRH